MSQDGPNDGNDGKPPGFGNPNQTILGLQAIPEMKTPGEQHADPAAPQSPPVAGQQPLPPPDGGAPGVPSGGPDTWQGQGDRRQPPPPFGNRHAPEPAGPPADQGGYVHQPPPATGPMGGPPGQFPTGTPQTGSPQAGPPPGAMPGSGPMPQQPGAPGMQGPAGQAGPHAAIQGQVPHAPSGPQVGHPPGAAASGRWSTLILRAFRTRVADAPVLPEERAALAVALPPIQEPKAQAFLAWRRSLLFVVACLFIPVVVFATIDLFKDIKETPGIFIAQEVIALLVAIGLAVVLWMMLGRWTSWQRQRKPLAWAWAGYFLSLFAFYLLPLAAIAVPEGAGRGARLQAGTIVMIMSFFFLAPKLASLLPGVIRASVITKLFFPGSAAPGWLMVGAGTFYGMLLYVVLVGPYQLFSSGWFIPAMIGLVGAPVWMVMAGFRLTKPMPNERALQILKTARIVYISATWFGLLCLFAGLGADMEFGALAIFKLLFELLANVLLLTLIATDFIFLGLERARGNTADTGSRELYAHYEDELGRFIAMHQPPVQSYPGPQPPAGGPQGYAQPPGQSSPLGVAPGGAQPPAGGPGQDRSQW